VGNFVKGLLIGLLGAVLWVVASVVAAFAAFAQGNDDPFASPVAGALMVIGFAAMILGPVAFWIVAPLVALIRRPRGGDPLPCHHVSAPYCGRCGAYVGPGVAQ
jgi:hypothetical protein